MLVFFTFLLQNVLTLCFRYGIMLSIRLGERGKLPKEEERLL